jgi:putative oxidoreductase
MDLQLNGKTAVVTGASRGIGRAIAETLADEGARVLAVARSFDAAFADGIETVELDLAASDAGTTLAERVRDIDVLVNNLGRFDARTEGFSAVDDDAWLQTLELNLLSTVRVTRALLPAIAAPGGVIVNVSSVNARQPESLVVDYAAAKAALSNVSKLLAEELGPRGIRVNTISPGPTLTPAWQDGPFGRALAGATGLPLDEVLETLPEQSGITIGRLVEPSEVAALCAFLASPRASGITGADYRIDGGLLKST